MTEELKRRLVGVAVLLAVFSLIAWWVGSRSDQSGDMPSSEADIRNYDVRELDRIAEAQRPQQAIPEPPSETGGQESTGTEQAADAEPAQTTESDKAGTSPAQPAPQEAGEEAPGQAAGEDKQQAEQADESASTAAEKPATEPAKQAETEQSQVSRPATDPEGSWIVQVASVTNQGNAQSLVDRLKEKGWKSFIAQGVVNDKTYYRVRVGPYAQRPQAETAAEALQEELGSEAAVMSR